MENLSLNVRLNKLSNTNRSIYDRYKNAYGDYWLRYPIKYKECWHFSNDEYFISLINSDLNDIAPFQTNQGVCNLLEYLKELKQSNIIPYIDFLFMKIPTGQVNLDLYRLKSLILDEFKINFFDYFGNLIRIIKFANPLIIYLEVGIECLDYILNVLAKNNIVLLDSFRINRTQKILRLTNQKAYLDSNIDNIFLSEGSLDNIRDENFSFIHKNELSELNDLNKKNRNFNLESLFLKDVSLLSFSDRIRNIDNKNNTFHILDLTTDLGIWGRIAYKYKYKYIGLDLNQRKLANFIGFLHQKHIELNKL